MITVRIIVRIAMFYYNTFLIFNCSNIVFLQVLDDIFLSGIDVTTPSVDFNGVTLVVIGLDMTG